MRMTHIPLIRCVLCVRIEDWRARVAQELHQRAIEPREVFARCQRFGEK